MAEGEAYTVEIAGYGRTSPRHVGADFWGAKVATRQAHWVTSGSRFLRLLLLLILLYLGLGLGFHLKWQSDLAACREARTARGEFVEPEVFGGPLALVFDLTYWPVFVWANIYHHGTPFATPCTH